MKTRVSRHSIWPALLVAVAFPLSSLEAFDPLADIPSQIGVLVEYYEVDYGTATNLLDDYLKEPDATAMLGNVRELVERGEARLADSAYVVSPIHGQRVKVESAREIIYAVDSVPEETGDQESTADPPSSPVSYVMRPVGLTLEFEASTDEGGNLVNINFAPELVEFHGFESQDPATAEPIFKSAKLQTAMTVPMGGCELFGVFPASGESNPENKRLLGFISPARQASISRDDLEKFRQDPGAFTSAKRADLAESNSDTTGADPLPDPFGSVADTSPEAGAIAEDATADPFGAATDGSPPVGPRQLRLIVEYIDVDAGFASRMIRELDNSTDATPLRRSIGELITRGEAGMVETGALPMNVGQRGKVEWIGGSDKGARPAVPESEHESKAPITVFGRNVFKGGYGGALEADVNENADGTIYSLSVATELVRRAMAPRSETGVAPAGRSVFESLKIQTTVAIPEGTCILLAMHSLETARAGEGIAEEEREAARGRRILVFLTAKAVGKESR